MGCELSKQLCKTLSRCTSLCLWSEVRGLKQVLLAISRVRPNNDVTTENDKSRNTGCGNECNQPIFHYSAKVSCESPTSLAAAGTINDCVKAARVGASINFIIEETKSLVLPFGMPTVIN